MASRNDITGDLIKTGSTSDDFRNGWELIFGKKEEKPKKKKKAEVVETVEEEVTEPVVEE